MTASSSRRYLSVWLRRLATDRIARLSPATADGPLVVVASIESALRVTALNDAAAHLRLRPGMGLADARAMYPSLPVMNADAEADRRLLVAIADWCDRYTPLVGLDAPDGLVLDIAGCVHLFNGEASLCRDLVARLEAQGLSARVAVADTVGCAWGVARYGAGKIIPPGGQCDAMAPLPLAALRLAPETLEALAQVGLKRIADVLDKPRAPFAARFGADFIRRVDQALGRIDEPITPRLPVPAAMAERRFPDPIAREDDVLGVIEQLARDLARLLETRGEGARLLQAALFRADGKVHRLELGTAAPLRDPARMRRLFTERFAALGDECDPGFGYDMMRLSALVTERSDPPQTGFGVAGEEADVSHLIDRLGARFGLRRVTRLTPQDTHIPEFASLAVPAHAPQAKERREPRKAVASSKDALNALPQDDGIAAQDSQIPARPARLFARPEPVDVIAEVPEGPPRRFRWRQIMHEIAFAEGPERIAMEWWRDANGTPLTRDYFRVESKDGARVWLYREGLYGREADKPRWFLHGLFA